ncbi:MAG: hypothetical protein ACFFBS_08070 [Promethearchaeota archaeon]
MSGREGIGTWPTPEKRRKIIKIIEEVIERLGRLRELLEER